MRKNEEELRFFTSTYVLMNEELQAAILDNIDAVVIVTRSTKLLPLLQLNQHHVTTELQEKRLLKVTQHSLNIMGEKQNALRCYSPNPTHKGGKHFTF